jgi:hypothetical protein
VGRGTFDISDEVLTDSWTFERGQTWQNDLVGQTAYQGAPARIVRNIKLPRVTSSGESPFIFASRFPNGAVAIGAQERTHSVRAWYLPASEVELDVEDAPGPYGIFGSFTMLTLIFDRPLHRRRVIAQDLAGDQSMDITDRVSIDGRSLRLADADLRMVGLHAATDGDLSSPGMILALR